MKPYYINLHILIMIKSKNSSKALRKDDTYIVSSSHLGQRLINSSLVLLGHVYCFKGSLQVEDLSNELEIGLYGVKDAEELSGDPFPSQFPSLWHVILRKFTAKRVCGRVDTSTFMDHNQHYGIPL